MAIGPTFEPQIGPLGIVGALQQGQSHQMSMMERAQSVKQQKLRTQMLEAQRQQWELEAPIRNAQLQTGLADAANQLYAAQELSKATAEVTSRGPEFMQMMKDADTQVNGADGKADYAVNYQKWSDIAKAVSPYAHTAKGKQMLEAANNQQLFYKTRIASEASFKMAEMKQKFEMEKLAAKHAATMEEAKARGVGQGKPIGITANEITEWEAITREPSGLKPGDNVIIRYDDSGNMISVSAPSVMYQSASRAGEMAFGKKLGEEQAKELGELQTNVREASMAADNMLVNINRLYDLYDSGLKTGGGQKYITEVQNFAYRFAGIGSPGKLATQQEAQQAFNSMALDATRMFLKGQGQVTEAERALVERAIASAGFSPDANKKIMEVLLKAGRRAKEAQTEMINLRRKAARGEIAPSEIAVLMDEWYSKPENSIGAEALANIDSCSNQTGGESSSSQFSDVDSYINSVLSKQSK